MTTRTQKDKVLNHLKRRPLGIKEAINKLGVRSLTSVISKLRQEGYDIDTQRNMNTQTGKKVVTYRLLN